jgi:hypothetical protein
MGEDRSGTGGRGSVLVGRGTAGGGTGRGGSSEREIRDTMANLPLARAMDWGTHIWRLLVRMRHGQNTAMTSPHGIRFLRGAIEPVKKGIEGFLLAGSGIECFYIGNGGEGVVDESGCSCSFAMLRGKGGARVRKRAWTNVRIGRITSIRAKEHSRGKRRGGVGVVCFSAAKVSSV